MILLIVFGVVIFLELLCIVGLFFALRWLRRGHLMLLGAKIMLPMICSALQQNGSFLKQLSSGLDQAKRFIPRWLRITFIAAQWTLRRRGI
jgi:hypothetical protein